MYRVLRRDSASNSLNRKTYVNLLDLVDFLAEMEQPYLSMNMVIRTGEAVRSTEIGYNEIGGLVLPQKEWPMKTSQLLRFFDEQTRAIEALIDQLDQIQVAFNAQFDEFKAQHDATLDRLTDQVAERLHAVDPNLRAAIDGQVVVEREAIAERRRKVREEYLPQRQQAADELLQKAQAELAKLRALNPQLDEKEEKFKRGKAALERQLEELNDLIRQKSRGLGVVRHFVAITQADRERQRIIGRLEGINDSLYDLRRQWQQESAKIEKQQTEYQQQWQLESIAVARLQSELDQLSDENRSEELALQRAIRHVLDNLKEQSPSPDPDLQAGLQEMVELNIQTDDFHAGLASVGGFIGLLRGIDSGMQAVRKSVEGLQNEQQMHSAYLKPLSFSLPTDVKAFHRQWLPLTTRFADEATIGSHPAQFSANVRPILEGSLSQANIEAMFNSLSRMLKQATAHW